MLRSLVGSEMCIRDRYGELAEWSNAAVLKTVDGLNRPGVRIPHSPPLLSVTYSDNRAKMLLADCLSGNLYECPHTLSVRVAAPLPASLYRSQRVRDPGQHRAIEVARSTFSWVIKAVTSEGNYLCFVKSCPNRVLSNNFREVKSQRTVVYIGLQCRV